MGVWLGGGTKTALYFDAVYRGIDIIIEAGTKYISGHSDVSMGFVVSNGKTTSSIRNYAQNTGICVAPDEHYLAMQGYAYHGYPVAAI